MPADEAYVLSPTDVRNIRSYVQHKYAAMPQEKRAAIVADAVKRIIHKQLPNFESSIKRSVTEILIRTAVLERQGPVRAEDIFRVCLSLDRSVPELYEPLHKWIELQLSMTCTKAVMQRVMDELFQTMGQCDLMVREAQSGLLAQLKSMLIAEGVEIMNEPSFKSAGDVITLPIVPMGMPLSRRLHIRAFVYALLSAFLISASLLYGWSLSKPSLSGKLQPTVVTEHAPQLIAKEVGLPVELRYRSINQARLIDYLNKKSSILAEQPYFDAIVAAAETFDIHPVILFAITGQEQGFVPKTNKQHKEIANNPFNVFHSWQDFNTNIGQSAEIAARTVFNLSKDRPAEVDPFTWINRKYAEDPNWSDGVRSIFTAIVAYLESPSSVE
ncbi:hypothetical protein BK133_01890 [Paenibacillus sp. FSL H8-0548]|uniref:hypothetical protein n=1 Tax=Paenibacillus sp. FSL H8-0548 TaxID=1920422 RepID=UPI00096DFBA7|nr:hypothetical protein [Paenibacillus sp. FSL H8-0548]OMF38303.1 hypothetical protein BK133_01890 [Paenibacillus sp. FSL H8-0548]